MDERKEFNAQLSKKNHTVENSLDQRLDGLQSEMDKKIDNMHYSISRVAQQLDHQGEENPEDVCFTETILGEQAVVAKSQFSLASEKSCSAQQ